MADQIKLILILIGVMAIFLGIAFISPGNKKDFGKVINEYQTQGKTQQANPEDIRKGFKK